MSGGGTTDRQARSDRRAKYGLLILLTIVTVPLVALVVHALGLHYDASSDIATLELRVRDVGTAHTPLVGAYSRFHWNHPGPLLFYALALPYRILGADGAALLAGSALVNGVFVLAAAILVWRRGGVAGLALGLVVILTLMRALGGGLLQSGWNPYMVVVPLFVLVLIVWSITCGDLLLLPAAVAVASWSVQTHIGAAPIAGAGLLVAVVAVGVATRRGAVHRPLRLWATATIVGLVLWVPPIIDATHAHGGNVGDLWHYWTSTHPDLTGWARAGRIVVSNLDLPAPWMTGHESVSPFGGGGLDPAWHVPWTLVVLMVAIVVARRRRDRPAFALGLLAVGLGVVAWIATARVVGEPYSYVVRWTWLVGATAWLAIGWTAMGLLRDRVHDQSARRLGVAACGVVAIALSIASTASAVNAEPLFSDSSRLVGAVRDAMVVAARRAPKPILVQSAPGFESEEATSGVALALASAGIRSGRPSDLEWQLGAAHVVAPAAARTTWLVASNAQVTPLLDDPRYREVVAYDGLRPSERAADERIRAALPKAEAGIAGLRRWIRDHPRQWQRFNRLEARGDRLSVFQVEPR